MRGRLLLAAGLTACAGTALGAGAYIEEDACFGGTVPSNPTGSTATATVVRPNGSFSVTAWREACQSDPGEYVLMLKLSPQSGAPSVGEFTAWQAGVGKRGMLLVKDPRAPLLINYALIGSFSATTNVIVAQLSGARFDPGSALDLYFSDSSAGSLGAVSLHLAPMPNRPPTASVTVANGNLTDMWWDPAENGTGMSIVQHGSNQLFAIWYTYAPSGEPLWIVLPGGEWRDNKTFTGALFRTRGTSYTQQWNPANYTAGASVGTGTLTFTEADSATFSYTVSGVSGSRTYTRLKY